MGASTQVTTAKYTAIIDRLSIGTQKGPPIGVQKGPLPSGLSR
jgi:hypothetical protein